MENIKITRNKTKLSQSEFAKKFGIPVRTLQKWEQKEADPLPYLLSLIQDEISYEEYVDVTKYLFKHQNKFKPVIKTKFKNIERIHPLQQQRVLNIINELKKYKEISKIIVFGSSTTYKCNYESDIDLYVELLNKRNVKTYQVDCPVDFWSNYTIDPLMKKEVLAKGVVVYAR